MRRAHGCRIGRELHMDQTHEFDAATAGSRRRGLGLRARVLGAILVVALTTVGVGAFGIQRMSALSGKADQVYTDGAAPLDALRQLQSAWWEFSAQTARANIVSLPEATKANSLQGAKAAMGRLTGL